MDRMERLIHRVKVASGIEEATETERQVYHPISNDDLEKLSGEQHRYGGPVKIFWREGHLPPHRFDQGYIMGLPVEHDLDLGAVVHIPEPYVEKEAPEPEWITLTDLLANPLVKRVHCG